MKRVIKKVFSFLFLILVVISLFFLFRWIINGNKNNLGNKTDDKKTPPVPDSPLPPLDTENWWLTDEEINHAYQEMEKELGNSSEIKLVSPSVVRVIQEGGEISEELKQDKIIFFPINNSEHHETGDGGSHWTLLVFAGGESDTFFNYNSLEYSVTPENAMKVANNFHEKANKAGWPFVENVKKIPRQSNNADCGVYVIAFTRALIKKKKTRRETSKCQFRRKRFNFHYCRRKKLKDAGFPKKGSDGGNYDIGDDIEYLESEENRILEWYENPDTPLRKSIEFEWDYNSLGLSCSATKSERARSLQEFSKKIRLLSGVGKIEKEKLKKIYKVKKTLKYYSLSPEEYDSSQPPSKYIDGWVRTTDEFKEISDLYKIHFPGK